MRTNTEDRLLSRDDVAERFGLSRRWLELAAHKGEGPPMHKISRRMVRYKPSDVEAWLAERRISHSAMRG